MITLRVSLFASCVLTLSAAACSSRTITITVPAEAGASTATDTVGNQVAPVTDAGARSDGGASVESDSGAKRDATSTKDSSTATACGPVAVPTPSSPNPAYKPYLKQAACTSAQIQSFYTACVDANATSATCQNWQTSSPACGACILTAGTDASWGPILLIGNGDTPFNVAGCFGLTLNEGVSTTGCGAARWAFDRCLRSSCPVSSCFADPSNPTVQEEQDYEACRELAAQTTCAPVVAQVDTKCAALSSEAGAAALRVNCPLDGTLEQFSVGIATAFCGGL
jgi:hypothetical protein